MVYNITNVFRFIGSGIENNHAIRAIGNPLFPLVAISLMFIIILAIITYKSKSSWKLFSVAAIITLAGTTGILFLNKYMANKSSSSKSYSGGSRNIQLPDSSFYDIGDTTNHVPETNQNLNHHQSIGYAKSAVALPAAAFDDIFSS